MGSTLPIRSRLPNGTHVRHYPEIDSTSREAARLASRALDLPCWIICDVQTGGYGRRNRTWSQTHGDFAGTLMVTPKGEDNSLSSYSFITALAVHGAIAQFVGEHSSTLVKAKWPNDILINGKKTAGILLELLGTTHARILSIGIGINVVSHPNNIPYPATDLSQTHINPTITQITQSLDHHIHHWESVWCMHGFSAIKTAWLEIAHGLGEPVTVRLSDRTLHGTFETISDTGEIVILNEGKRRYLSTGDVFFG